MNTTKLRVLYLWLSIKILPYTAFGDYTGNALYLAVFDYSDFATYIVWLPANPEPYKNNVTLNYETRYKSLNHYYTSIFTDYETGHVTFHDMDNHWVYLTEPGGMPGPLAGGTSGRVDGLTIDHLAKNVYWVDEGYNWIKMTNYTGGGVTIIIDAGLERPSDIACHPQMGYLFWTELGNIYPPKIERSSMSGKNRTTIVTDVEVPVSITVDIDTNRIYWVDNSGTESKIESSDLDGNNRHVEVSQSLGLGAFNDISVDEDYIFVSILTPSGSLIRYYNKTSPVELIFEYNFGTEIDIYDVHVAGPNVQPQPATLPCNSNPCDHYCVSAANENYECVCREYFELDANNTCLDLKLIKPQPPFCVLGLDDSISRFDPRLLHHDLPSKQEFVSDIWKGNGLITSVAVDVHSNQMFYADDVSKSIYSARMVDGETPIQIHNSIGRVDGMAVDWLSLKLYWVDNDNNHLKFSNYDGSNSSVIFNDIIKPRAIAVDPMASLIIWTEISSPAKLVRCDYGGSNRHVILDTDLQTPSGITLDYQHEIIYIVDESRYVYYSSYDGLAHGILTVLVFPASDVTLFQDFLLLAETYYVDQGIIEGIHKITGEHEGYVGLNSSVYAVDIVDESRQPLADQDVTVTPPEEALTTISSKTFLDQITITPQEEAFTTTSSSKTTLEKSTQMPPEEAFTTTSSKTTLEQTTPTPTEEALSTISSQAELKQTTRTPPEEALTIVSSRTTLNQTTMTTLEKLVADKSTTLEKNSVAASSSTYKDVEEKVSDNRGSIVGGSIGASAIIFVIIVTVIAVSVKRSVHPKKQDQDQFVDQQYASHIQEKHPVQNTIGISNIEKDVLSPPTPNRPELTPVVVVPNEYLELTPNSKKLENVSDY